MINKIYECDDEEFINLVKSSTCIKEILFKLGYTTNGNTWGYSLVKQRMQILNLTTADLKGRSPMSIKKYNIPNEKIFVQNGSHNRKLVRSRIIKDKLLPYKCSMCGITMWNDKTLSLEIDHINGINNDNRLSNLRFLCPNCHSQTSTYGAKNKDNMIQDFNITPELVELVKQTYSSLHSVKKISQKLGLKLIAVKQIFNMLGINKPHVKFVIRYDANMNEIKRYGSITETCEDIIKNHECKTIKIKTCRKTFMRNKDKLWLNSYWKIMDA